MERYKKNRDMLSLEECQLLKTKKICVVGCGGLGGYVIEMLSRLGVGYITVIDGDVFDVTNLNRQLLSTELNMGCSKAKVAKQRVEHINTNVGVVAIESYLTEENAVVLLNDHDVIVDATDGIEVRFLLQDTAKELKIPLVYGAIAGWYAQIATIMPGDDILSRIYKNHHGRGGEEKLGNPSFTPALAASIQVSEILKTILCRGEILRYKLLILDLYLNDYEIIDFL